jgi:flagellar biosynthesis/type III secretory pathway chaperone
MANDFIDIATSLVEIIEEETARLLAPGRHRDYAEMTAAKIKLAAALEVQVARRNRTRDQWLDSLDAETREAVTETVSRLLAAAEANARVLERQIDLSTDMMGAVAAEACRLSGTRSSTYGVRGMITATDAATPISINTSL